MLDLGGAPRRYVMVMTEVSFLGTCLHRSSRCSRQLCGGTRRQWPSLAQRSWKPALAADRRCSGGAQCGGDHAAAILLEEVRDVMAQLGVDTIKGLRDVHVGTL